MVGDDVGDETRLWGHFDLNHDSGGICHKMDTSFFECHCQSAEHGKCAPKDTEGAGLKDHVKDHKRGDDQNGQMVDYY